MHFIKYLVCIKYTSDIWIWFGYEALFFKYDVMVYILLTIFKHGYNVFEPNIFAC